MRSINFASRGLLGLPVCVCLASGCAQLPVKAGAPVTSESARRKLITADNQAGIWVAGLTLYSKGQYLEAADLFQLAYRLKPARRISQNIGMAYFKAAQRAESPEVLRLEYIRRALPYFQSYRAWLSEDYGRSHDVSAPLADTDRRIAEAELLITEIRGKIDPEAKIVAEESEAEAEAEKKEE